MPQPTRKPYTPPTWALPPSPDVRTARQLAQIERAARAAAAPRPHRQEPICFAPVHEPEDTTTAADWTVFGLAVWIVCCVVVALWSGQA